MTPGQFSIRWPEMKRREAIRRIRVAAAERRLIFTGHALDEMDEEGETRQSVASVLERAGSFTLQKNGRWRLHGEGLTVIVQVDEPTVIVWTVFAG